jgi:death on curing protein
VTDPEHLDVDYLDVEDLLGMIRRLRVGPVRDLGLLDAACARPRASAFGQDAYPTVVQKAAAFLESLVGSHPLVDGNERLGWLATTVLLDLNGVRVGLDDDEAFTLVMTVAEGGLDLPGIVEQLSAR